MLTEYLVFPHVEPASFCMIIFFLNCDTFLKCGLNFNERFRVAPINFSNITFTTAIKYSLNLIMTYTYIYRDKNINYNEITLKNIFLIP